MADLTSKTHVSPPLMHAFRAAHEAKDAANKIDVRTDCGDRVIAGRRLRPRQVITEQVLRREVARDLDALLNTVAMESTVDMTDAPYVRKSILNFGLPDIATAPSIDARSKESRGHQSGDHQLRAPPRGGLAGNRARPDAWIRPSSRSDSGPRRFDVLSDSGSGRIRRRRHRKRKNYRQSICNRA